MAASGNHMSTSGNARTPAQRWLEGAGDVSTAQRLLACNIQLRGLRFGSGLQSSPKPTGPSQSDAKRELRLLVTGASAVKPTPRQVDLHSMD